MASFEILENKKAKVTIEIGIETFDEAVKNAYQKAKSRYNVPGFRKGKAPKRMIENMYGEGVFLEDAFELVYQSSYQAAIKELDLHPVEQPDISIDKIGEGEGVVYTAEFAVRPEVVLGKYKGIEVVKREYTVDEKEIDAALNQERERVARYVEQDRPVENGDRVLLDYSGAVDGIKFDGGTAENQTLDIGSGTFIPGFEEQLVGMGKDEEKDITVTFPEDYHAKDLSGKPAVFAVKIKGIQVKELPALDDEFAQDISEFETLEALREDKRAALQKRNEERAKNEMEDEAVNAATKNAAFDLPVAMIERQMDYMLQDIAYRLSMSGLNLEDYCRYTGTDARTMREGYREEAERRVRTQLVLEAICKAEKIEATDEDVEKELSEYAQRANKELEEYKKTIPEEELPYLKERIQVDKTIDLLLANAKFVEEGKKKAPKKAKTADKPAEAAKEGEEKPKPAKKAAAKSKPAEKVAEKEI